MPAGPDRWWHERGPGRSVPLMVEPVYAPVVVAAQGAFKALGLKLHVTGGENVPRHGGAVLAS